MAIILVESPAQRGKYYPVTHTRSIADMGWGIFTLREWWMAVTGQAVHVLTGDYLQTNLPELNDESHYFVRSGLVPTAELWEAMQEDKASFFVDTDNRFLAFSGAAVGMDGRTEKQLLDLFANEPVKLPATQKRREWKQTAAVVLETPESLLRQLGQLIGVQFDWITGTGVSAPLSATNQVKGAKRVFLAPGAKVEFALLNADTGPIYIGEDAEVMEGAMIRGPFSLGAGAVVKMGARIYGATATGPKCILGGEIKNVLFHKGTNKGHDGYLGDSIVGAWCNFGAGSGNSNVKNTGGEVSLYDYTSDSYRAVGHKFGLLMGDYTRVAIGSSINTGSSIGVCCNVFGPGLLPRRLPEFSWGTGSSLAPYSIEKAMLHLENWMAFKGERPSALEIQILRHIFEHIGS